MRARVAGSRRRAGIRLPARRLNERIRWYLSHFDYGKEVKTLNEVIQVDDMVRGCPMKVPSFLQTLNKYLELFGIVEHA